MKNHLYVLLPLIIAVGLRLYPYATSGVPFSTDAWAPIRNTELLIEHSPINLGNDEVFDGYNNYWPANSIFGTIFSELTGVEPKKSMPPILPIIGSMVILIFYVLVKRLYNAKISFLASIIFATAFTHAYFTAAVTKETYANPLYLLLILIFLHPTIDKSKQAVLFTITSVALAFTHHFSPLIAMAILFSIALARLIHNVKNGLDPNEFDFLLLSILTTVTTLYYLLYAQAGYKIPLNLSDWISVFSYQTLTFALSIYVTTKPHESTMARRLLVGAGAASATFTFTLLATMIPVIPGFPTFPRHYMVYNVPYVITIFLIILGYSYKRGGRTIIAPLFWLASIIGLEAYAVFGNSVLTLPLSNRTINFLHPPMAILAAAGLYQLCAAFRKTRLKTLINLTTMTTILLIVSLNTYSLYAAISLEERYMGYHWLYRTEEYNAGAWIATISNDPTVAGDMKVAYLMQHYFNAKADVLQGFQYLTETDKSPPEIMFTYSQMFKNGYVIGHHGVDLPENWMKKTDRINLIYSDGLAQIYTWENA